LYLARLRSLDRGEASLFVLSKEACIAFLFAESLRRLSSLTSLAFYLIIPITLSLLTIGLIRRKSYSVERIRRSEKISCPL